MDQLFLVTVDYMRNRAAYSRALGPILERTPDETYVIMNPTPARNKKAIIETFEFTIFSLVLTRMPPHY